MRLPLLCAHSLLCGCPLLCAHSLLCGCPLLCAPPPHLFLIRCSASCDPRRHRVERSAPAHTKCKPMFRTQCTNLARVQTLLATPRGRGRTPVQSAAGAPVRRRTPVPHALSAAPGRALGAGTTSDCHSTCWALGHPTPRGPGHPVRRAAGAPVRRRAPVPHAPSARLQAALWARAQPAEGHSTCWALGHPTPRGRGPPCAAPLGHRSAAGHRSPMLPQRGSRPRSGRRHNHLRVTVHAGHSAILLRAVGGPRAPRRRGTGPPHDNGPPCSLSAAPGRALGAGTTS